MNKETTYYNNKHYERIDKRQARKAFAAGENILICPSNMTLYSNIIWACAYEINNKKCDQFDTFDTVINNFEYYNCNRESGTYTKFYKEEV